jgi:GAF domain-containing protein
VDTRIAPRAISTPAGDGLLPAGDAGSPPDRPEARPADPEPGHTRAGRDTWLARTFVELSDTVATDFDPAEQASLLVRSFTELVDHVEVGVVVADHAGVLEVTAGSTERMRVLQLFEIDIREGPSIESHRDGTPLVDVRLCERGGTWDRYGPMARAVGFRRVHAFPMRVRDEIVGAVCLADTRETPLRPEEIELGTMLAASATVGILHQRAVCQYSILSGQLQGALNSRVLIEQAKGMVAERLHVGTRDAFELLRRYARSHGLPLKTVANAAIDGELGTADLLQGRPRPQISAHERRLVERPA